MSVQMILKEFLNIPYASNKGRLQMLALSRKLTAALETPSEAIQRIGWAEPACAAAIRLAIDLRIFELLEKSSSLSSQELAIASGAEEALIARTMKHLAAMHIVREDGADRYSGTNLSNACTLPEYHDGLIYTYDVAGPSFRNMPQYLKETKYQNPTKLADGPFQAAHNTQVPFFVWLGENPKYLEAFNHYMGGYRKGKASWMDPGFFPVKTLGENVGESDVLLVDVGGGLGHDLKELKVKHPELPGRLILQEKPEVIQQIKDATEGIELTEHDFFTKQPVVGARAYFLHSVLHDWDDETCRKILLQLRPAMTPKRSKLLIHENVVPDAGADWSITSMDWLMMALGAVRERTEADWDRLLKAAGFKIAKIWTYDQSTESLIEADVDDAFAPSSET